MSFSRGANDSTGSGWTPRRQIGYRGGGASRCLRTRRSSLVYSIGGYRSFRSLAFVANLLPSRRRPSVRHSHAVSRASSAGRRPVLPSELEAVCLTHGKGLPSRVERVSYFLLGLLGHVAARRLFGCPRLCFPAVPSRGPRKAFSPSFPMPAGDAGLLPSSWVSVSS